MPRHSLWTLALLLFLAPPPADAGSVRFHLVRRDGPGFRLEAVDVAEGESRTFACGAGSDYVDVICPPAVGGSAGVAQARPPREVTLRCQAGQARVTTRFAGRTYDMQRLDDPAGADCRVSLVGADGGLQAFLLRGFATAEPDTVGPVTDLFAGRVPLQPGDVVVCTDTWRRRTGPAARGRVALTYDHYLFTPVQAGPARGTAIVDLAAGQTVISRALLPAGVPTHPAQMARYTAGVLQLDDYAAGGATGSATGFEEATLPALTVGDITFPEVDVLVMPALPELNGRSLHAILGLDLLRRAAALTLRYPVPGGSAASLELHDAAPAAGAEARVTLPFALVSSHLMIPGRAAGRRGAFLVDTGAPDTYLDPPWVSAAGLPTGPAERPLRGLGGQEMKSAATRIPRLALGSRELRDVPAAVAPLASFASLHVHDQAVGLLGNDVLARLVRLEIDFTAGRVAFPAR